MNPPVYYFGCYVDKSKAVNYFFTLTPYFNFILSPIPPISPIQIVLPTAPFVSFCSNALLGTHIIIPMFFQEVSPQKGRPEALFLFLLVQPWQTEWLGVGRGCPGNWWTHQSLEVFKRRVDVALHEIVHWWTC